MTGSHHSSGAGASAHGAGAASGLGGAARPPNGISQWAALANALAAGGEDADFRHDESAGGGFTGASGSESQSQSDKDLAAALADAALRGAGLSSNGPFGPDYGSAFDDGGDGGDDDEGDDEDGGAVQRRVARALGARPLSPSAFVTRPVYGDFDGDADGDGAAGRTKQATGSASAAAASDDRSRASRRRTANSGPVSDAAAALRYAAAMSHAADAGSMADPDLTGAY